MEKYVNMNRVHVVYFLLWCLLCAPVNAEVSDSTKANENNQCVNVAFNFIDCIGFDGYKNIPDMQQNRLDSNRCDRVFRQIESYDMINNHVAYNDFKKEFTLEQQTCITETVYKKGDVLGLCQNIGSTTKLNCTCSKHGTLDKCGCSESYVQCRKNRCESISHAISDYRDKLMKSCMNNKGISEISGKMTDFLNQPLANESLTTNCKTNSEGSFTCKLSSEDIKNFKFKKCDVISSHGVIYEDDMAHKRIIIILQNNPQDNHISQHQEQIDSKFESDAQALHKAFLSKLEQLKQSNN